MMDLQGFCAEFGVDEAAAAQCLESPGEAAGPPWYVRGFLAFGAWITAIAIVVFFGVFIGLVFDDSDAFDGVLTVLGIGCFALGMSMLAKAPGGAFRISFATALAAAGAAMAAAGIGIMTEEIWAAAIAAVILAGLVVAWATGVILQLLVSGLAVALIAIALVVEEVPYYLDVAAVLMLGGVVLWCRPPRRDMRATAFALLMAPPALSIFTRFESWMDFAAGGWGARAVHIGLFAWLVSILWRHMPERHGRIELAIFAVASVAVCLLLPPGGSGALVILTLAFVLGSRPLALIGALLQSYFFWQFYYDLDISLLHKSMLLTAVGAVILACWWVIAGRSSRRSGS